MKPITLSDIEQVLRQAYWNCPKDGLFRGTCPRLFRQQQSKCNKCNGLKQARFISDLKDRVFSRQGDKERHKMLTLLDLDRMIFEIPKKRYDRGLMTEEEIKSYEECMKAAEKEFSQFSPY